jgi:hypothetical protein
MSRSSVAAGLMLFDCSGERFAKRLTRVIIDVVGHGRVSPLIVA